MCLKGFFNEVGSKVKYRLNFLIENTFQLFRLFQFLSYLDILFICYSSRK